MRPINPSILNRLPLEEAATEEADSNQTLLPPTPGMHSIKENRKGFVSSLRGLLQAGMPTTPQFVVSARKIQHGVRPVPIWGVSERVVYRAITKLLLKDHQPLNRSPEAYASFLGGPLLYARDLEPKPPADDPFATPADLDFPVSSSVIKYVVKADISSFYEYIDHSVLAHELLLLTGNYPLIEHLVDLLGEVQGRSYGLPQLLDASDQLSDIYIDIVEREILRKGWPAWRFNDDFRIAVRSFGDALAAVEDLAAAARRVGLTLSDMKTTTPKFSTYAYENFGLRTDDKIPAEIKRHVPEDALLDYFDGGVEGVPTFAISLLQNTKTPEDHAPETDGIKLGNIKSEQIRRLRRALTYLAKDGPAEGLPHLKKIVAYTPSLTPWVMRYIIAAGETDPGAASAVLMEVIKEVSLSDWQRAWAIRAISSLGLLQSSAPGDPDALVQWVTRQWHRTRTAAVRAEAALALAPVGGVNFNDVEASMRDQPEALAPWYLCAVRKLREQGQVPDKQYRAVRAGIISAALLDAI